MLMLRNVRPVFMSKEVFKRWLLVMSPAKRRKIIKGRRYYD